MKPYTHSLSIKYTVLSFAILTALHTSVALANPTGAQVVNGQVSISNSNGVTTIVNSPNAIINWQDFSINQGEITRFIQQNSQSAVLNRVIGQNPSQILGNLISNGKVFLINPNGVLFGANSVIDTQSLLTSTLNISNQDFLSGNYHFIAGDNAGGIVNEGVIRAGKNGNIVLIAPDINNNGIIKTDGGQIVLAAGEELTLTSLDDPQIRFQVQSPENEVLNLGQMLTEGGAIDLFGGTITHSGEINSESLTLDASGNITLKALSDITVADNAIIKASGADGATVKLESDQGDTIVRGTIEAKGNTGQGGTIHVLGQRVGLFGNAVVDASGETGGGEVLIGGDFQGKNPDIKNATQTVVGKNAHIDASANTTGDGGKAIVWADDFTEFHGSLNVSAGSQSGDGGFAEVSGKENLVYRGQIDATSAHGQAGNVLFDPKNITITSSAGVPILPSDEFSEAPSSSVDFTNADLEILLLGQNVTLQANNDITVDEDIFVSASGFGNDLTLQAGRNITINNTINTDGGDFFAYANSTVADGAVGAERDAGPAVINVNADIATSGGDIHLEIKNVPGLTGNLTLGANTSLISSGGNIDLITPMDVVLSSATFGAQVDSSDVGLGGGDVFIQANDVDIQSLADIITNVSTSPFAGNVTIVPYDTNRDITLGTAAGTLSLTQAEISRIGSLDGVNTLQIGRETDTGTLTVTDAFALGDVHADFFDLSHENITVNSVMEIDNAGGDTALSFTAANLLDINNAVDAAFVSIKANNVNIAPGANPIKVNINSILAANGIARPTLVQFDGTGTTFFRNDVLLHNVNMTAGTLDTSFGPTVFIDGIYNWTSGLGEIKGLLKLESASIMNMIGSSGGWQVTGTINNLGTINFQTDNTFNFGTGTINNLTGANINFNSDFTPSVGGTLNNTGTITKTDGSNLTFGSAINNQAGGVINVQSGVLDLIATGTNHDGSFSLLLGSVIEFGNAAGTVDFGANTIISGAGSVIFGSAGSGAITFNPLASYAVTGNTILSNGSLTLPTGATTGSFTMTSSNTARLLGDLTVANGFQWSTGKIDGTLTANGTTNMLGDIQLNGVFNNNGTVNWSAGDESGVVSTGTGFNNNASGIFNITGNNSFSQQFFNAGGTLTKSGGAGTTQFTTAFANGGTVTVNGFGVTLDFNGYTQTAGLTTLFGGTINNTAGPYVFNGGTLGGSGFVSGSAVNMNAGSTLSPGGVGIASILISGHLNLAAGSTTNIQIFNTTTYDRISLSNGVTLGGTLNVSLIGAFTGAVSDTFDIIQDSSSLINGAFATSNYPAGYTFNDSITGAGSIYQLEIAGLPAVAPIWTQTGTGTFLWSDVGNWSALPTGGEDIIIPSFAGDVLFDASAGTFAFNSLTINDDFTISGGSLTATTATFAAGTTFSLSGGAFTGTTTSLLGNFNWSGGTLNGALTTASASITNITNNVILNNTFNNGGTVNWSAGDVTDSGSGNFNNLATGNLIISSDNSFNPTVNNAGTVTKSVGLFLFGAATRFNSAFTNSGTVNANAGTLEFDGYTQTAGLTQLNTGFIDNTGGPSNFNGGTLAGDGRIDGGVNMNAGSTLSPGIAGADATATLRFNTGFLQLAAGSTTNLEFAGTALGQHDAIDAGFGGISLDGTLNLSLISGFTGAVADTFNIIFDLTNNIASSGNFATTNPPTAYTFITNLIGSPNPFLYQLEIASITAPVPTGAGPTTLIPNNPTVDIITLVGQAPGTPNPLGDDPDGKDLNQLALLLPLSINEIDGALEICY